MISSVILGRLAFAALIAVSCVAVYALIRALVLRKAGKASRLAGLFSPGTPGVVFFTTPDCAACKSIQRPALHDLRDRLDGKIQIIEIDAVERPDLASSWSVLSVPTTFILDATGKPVHVNHGVASVRKLLGQLALAG